MTYSDEAQARRWSGVPPTSSRRTAPSRPRPPWRWPTAARHADGRRPRRGSVTGIAGPDGGSAAEAGRPDLRRRWPTAPATEVRRYLWSGAGPTTSAPAPRRARARPRAASTRSRTRRDDRSADRVGAGLAPARDARPIRAGERIHVVGAAGAGASAAALLAATRRRRSSRAATPGGPSPYTPRARGGRASPSRWARSPRT